MKSNDILQRFENHPVAAALVVLALVTLSAGSVRAFPNIRSQFFQAYPEVNGSRLSALPGNSNHCGVCHLRFTGGGARNAFGQAVESLEERNAENIRALGSLDSDGDGFTNDEEILGLGFFRNTPTFPGLAQDDLGATSNIDTAVIKDFLVPQSSVVLDEAEEDPSDDPAQPTVISLDDDRSTIVVAQQGDALGRDIDYVTIVVPDGFVLSEVVVDDFEAEPENLAFLGVQAGSQFTVDAASATAEDLLGGIVFGAGEIGTDILPAIGSLPGAAGFSPPLRAGEYTLWFNQTGPRSTATLSFWLAVAPPDPSFIRGDCNQDQEVDISDAIGMLTRQFLGGDDPACIDACDSNDDGEFDISDPILVLDILFQLARPFPEPNGQCGPDPTDDPLSCDDPRACL